VDDAGRRGKRFRRSRVTAALARRAVAGILPGDHACASFGSDEEHQAIVGRYAGQALERRERLLYLAHTSDDGAIHRVLEEEGIDVEAALALGQIEIRRVVQEGPVDPEALVTALQADRRRALHDGYAALSATTEMSWSLAGAGELDAVVRYERDVNRVFAGAGIAGLCQYDRRLFDVDDHEQLMAAHQFQVRTAEGLTTTARRRLTISEHEGSVLAVAGALDIDSSALLAARLSELDGDHDIVLQTSGLGFADISGCRALIHAAESLDRGRRLLLPDPSTALVRVLELCGWADHGRLVLS